MKLRSIIGRHPFLFFGGIGMVLQIIILAGDLEYDAQGIEGLVWWIGYLFAIPMWLVQMLVLFPLGGGRAFLGFDVLSFVLTTLLCLGLDLLYRRIRARIRQLNSKQ